VGSSAHVECDACPVAFDGAVGWGMLGYGYTVVACTTCKDLVSVAGYLGTWGDGTVPVEELVPVPGSGLTVPEVLTCPECRHPARTLWPTTEDGDVPPAHKGDPDLGPCPRCRSGRLHEVSDAFDLLLCWD